MLGFLFGLFAFSMIFIIPVAIVILMIIYVPKIIRYSLDRQKKIDKIIDHFANSVDDKKNSS